MKYNPKKLDRNSSQVEIERDQSIEIDSRYRLKGNVSAIIEKPEKQGPTTVLKFIERAMEREKSRSMIEESREAKENSYIIKKKDEYD